MALDYTNVTLQSGSPEPLGATLTAEGVNFAVYSGGAARVELCLFDESGAQEVARFALPERTENVWHGFLPVPHGAVGLHYGYRAYGPFDPQYGLRYNPAKLLLDPYARAVGGTFAWNDALLGSISAAASTTPAEGAPTEQPSTLDSAPYNYKGRVVDPAFDWAGDRPPATPWRDSVIYELHVKGFTKLHSRVPQEQRGTYLGLAHPEVISYLKHLGITAVELLPVQAFIPERFLVEKGLVNYWGYNSIGFFAPHAAYSSSGTRGEQVTEFKTMVKALHEAGIEVILDVVFNHTAEGDGQGAALSWRGLDNTAYYKLEPANLRNYMNRTGTGNTIGIGHVVTRSMVIDCLRYWVEEMHVDGFRFDLAAVLGRDNGRFKTDAAFFRAVSAEPSLRYCKLIAEPWDVGPEGYQLGHFPPAWAEWNDLYRDTMRGFWRGNPGILGNFAERFAGSSDLFRSSGRRPTSSVNYVACHDGFTLYDATAYDEKHNEANLEDNRDGHNHNLSWNCGVEGGTQDEQVVELRERQVRNLLATVLLSQGVPMFQAGDEFGRTQRGNNNAYCQDNELSWVDWELGARRNWLTTFVRQLLILRRQAPGLRRDTFLKGARQVDREHKDVSWRHPLGHELSAADWHEDEARAIGVLIGQAFTDPHGTPNGHLLFLCNASAQQIDFKLPAPVTHAVWQIVFDTARWRANDLGNRIAAGENCVVAAHSCVLLADGDAPLSVRSGFSLT
jgi:glycogen operon protein